MRISVGDKVKRVRGEHAGMIAGDEGTVIESNWRGIVIREYNINKDGKDFHHKPSNFIKISRKNIVKEIIL